MPWYDGVKVTIIPKKAVFVTVPTREGLVQVPMAWNEKNQLLATLIEGLIYEVERKT